jgi:hypothetical protein
MAVTTGRPATREGGHGETRRLTTKRPGDRAGSPAAEPEF